jgi:hypothetical protein
MTQYVGRMLAQHEHISLGLPPYHPELNSTKHLGYYKKNWLAAKNVTFKFHD